MVCWDHDRRSISGLRLSVAIRTDARINSFFFPVILVRPERRRFAIAAVRAFVFPGINGQIVFSEMVICTSQKVSIALGAIANSQTFTGHLFAKKRVIWTVLGARRVRTQPREVAMSTIATPVPTAGINIVKAKASRDTSSDVAKREAILVPAFYKQVLGFSQNLSRFL